AGADGEPEQLGYGPAVELYLEVAGDHCQRRLGLEEGEVAPGAEAGTGPEGQEGLLVGRAALRLALFQPSLRVEPVAVLDGCEAGVASEQHQLRSGRNARGGNCSVGEGLDGEERRDRLEAHRLSEHRLAATEGLNRLVVHGRWVLAEDLARLLGHAALVLGTAGQKPERPRDRVRRGVLAREQHRERVADDFVVAEPAFGLL